MASRVSNYDDFLDRLDVFASDIDFLGEIRTRLARQLGHGPTDAQIGAAEGRVFDQANALDRQGLKMIRVNIETGFRIRFRQSVPQIRNRLGQIVTTGRAGVRRILDSLRE